MKHLSVYINWLMLTQTHLGHADTEMSIKPAPTSGMCILSDGFHSRPWDESLCPSSPLLAFWWVTKREVQHSELTFLGSFTYWKTSASCFSFCLKMLSFIQCCGSLQSATALNRIYCILPCYNWLYLAIPHLYNNNKPLKLKQFHFRKKNVISPWVNL